MPRLPAVASRANQKKRHHYVPVVYLSRFTDCTGRIFAYRKDNPPFPLHIRPSEIAFERYYYSQPIPGGGQDNNRLEDIFSEIEMYWPRLVDDLVEKRNMQAMHIEALFNFISLLRVRVPATRDPAELLLAHMVRRQLQRMIDAGEVPPLPSGVTLDDIEIAIDPHRSIHAMHAMLRGLADLWAFIGLEIVHNKTREPFATSDNPVAYFDPDVPEEKVLPYTVRPQERRVELLMPISPFLMIRGRTEVAVNRPGDQLTHTEMTSECEVHRVNRFVARFGYRFVFANHDGLDDLVAKHASLSPTTRFDFEPMANGSEVNFAKMVFGPRPRKPKW